MLVRFIPIAAALLATPGFAADSPKAPAQSATQRHVEHSQMVLASANEPGSAEATGDQTTTTKPMRVARVTTCRCGGQVSDPESQGDE